MNAPGGGRKPTDRDFVPRHCLACMRPLVFCRLARTESGKGGVPMPLDPVPTTAGNVAVHVTPTGSVVGRVLKKDESADEHVEVLYMPHAATCAAKGHTRTERQEATR